MVRPQHGWRAAAALDVTEDEKTVTLTAELPGVKESDIEVSLVGDQLTIKGEKRSEHDEKKQVEGRTLHRVERSYGAFQRTLTVPYQIDPDQISAEEHGSMATPSNKVRHLSVTILRDWQEVYAFAHLPENFPKWASGLAGSLHKNGVGWIAQTSTGQATVKFSQLNEYGVLDHWVTPDGGEEIYIPLRVIPNGSGALVTLTLFRLAEHSPESYAKDAETVAKDLRDLKELLEAE